MKTNCFIGLTGGIGSGKSTVGRFWSRYAKLPLIDIDHLCRELLEVEMPGWVALKESLGEVYFTPEGPLNRVALRSAIFEDDGLRNEVNRLIHPLALDLLYRKTKEIGPPVLVDVPLLFEAGWDDQFWRTIVVYSDQNTCCSRVVSRDSISPKEATKAIVSQMDIWEKAMRADHVVDNRYGWIHTRRQVAHLDQIIHEDHWR